jgi:excisionase family DNA binding protein
MAEKSEASNEGQRGKSMLLTVVEVAHELRISRSYTWSMVRSGGLPIVRIGRRVMVRREVVEQIAAHGWTRPDGSVPLRLVEHGAATHVTPCLSTLPSRWPAMTSALLRRRADDVERTYDAIGQLRRMYSAIYSETTEAHTQEQ